MRNIALFFLSIYFLISCTSTGQINTTDTPMNPGAEEYVTGPKGRQIEVFSPTRIESSDGKEIRIWEINGKGMNRENRPDRRPIVGHDIVKDDRVIVEGKKFSLLNKNNEINLYYNSLEFVATPFNFDYLFVRAPEGEKITITVIRQK